MSTSGKFELGLDDKPREGRKGINTRLALIGLALFYEGTLWLLYEYIVSPRWGYEHYSYASPPLKYIAVGIVLLVVCTQSLPYSITRPTQIIYWILFAFVVGPTFVVPYFLLPTLSISPHRIIEFQLVLTICFIALGHQYRKPVWNIPSFSRSPAGFWFWFAAFGFILDAIVVLRFGLKFHFSSLSAIYTQRALFSEQVGGLAGYAIGWLTFAVNPIFLARGLAQRKPVWMAIGLIGQLYIYSVAAYRLALASAFFMIAFTWLLSRRRDRFALYFLVGLAVIGIGAAILDNIFDFSFLTELATLRTFLTPASLSTVYLNFYSLHPLAYLGHSLLSGIVHTNYTAAPPTVIGSQVANVGADANANIWADAFANFGFYGMFIATAILWLLMRLVDGLMVGRDLRFCGLVLAMQAVCLTNLGILTALSSFGLGLVVVVCFLLPLDVSSRERRQHFYRQVKYRKRAGIASHSTPA